MLFHIITLNRVQLYLKKMFNKQILVYYQFCFIYLHVNFKNVA